MSIILCTIGPISENYESLKKILKYSNFVRLNGAHNTVEWHRKISRLIKSVNPEAVHLFDIPGIKPRTNNQKTISINLGELKSMGYKPFVVGLIAAVTVGIISLIYIETLKSLLI